MQPDDRNYMKLALKLAGSAVGRTSPNPLVGAVLVKDGRIVGQGCHLKAGTPHAEVHAIANAGDEANGSTLYVTLEPCSHHGRTGPCTEAVLKAGIKKVIAATTDPNPLVAGKGLDFLKKSGVEVEAGLMSNEAAKLNEVFIKWISTKMPFVIMKTAMTLDGKIATSAGHSRWITGPSARQQVHTIRDTCDAIMVGIGTVLTDDPQLTTRLPQGGKNPLRIVVDSMARTPLNANVVNDGQAPTIIAVTEEAPVEKTAALKAKGVEILVLPRSGTGVDLRKLFLILGQKQITSILLEGGATLNAAALTANVVDKVIAFIAPKIIGGVAAPGPVGGKGIQYLDDAVLLEDMEVTKIDEDIMISAYVATREGRDVYRTCGRTGQSESSCSRSIISTSYCQSQCHSQ